MKIPQSHLFFYVIAILLFTFCDVSRAQTPGPNNNVISGTTDQYTGDRFLQRQNEPTIAVSTRNQDHQLAASNDYRTVDLAGDSSIGATGEGLMTRFLAKLFGKSKSSSTHAAKKAEAEEEASAEAWIGVYRSFDRGHKHPCKISFTHCINRTLENLAKTIENHVRYSTDGFM